MLATRGCTDVGADARLLELGITLPPAFQPSANYVPAVRSGNLLFLSGLGPLRDDGTLITGRVGGAILLSEAVEAARLVALGLLSVIHAELGSLDRVTRVVKVLGMVNCQPGFNEMPAVLDGCSDLLVDVFGPEIGAHARSAVGMAELPFDIPVEIEMIVEFEANSTNWFS